MNVARFASQNTKVKTKRAYTLGWKPHHPGVMETLEGDIKLALQLDAKFDVGVSEKFTS